MALVGSVPLGRDTMNAIAPRVDHPSFPGAATLLSRAFWWCRAHPRASALVGLGTGAPIAAGALLLIHEARNAPPEEGVANLGPLAFGLAALAIARAPFRLALARFAARVGSADARPARIAAWTTAQVPAALFFAATASLGWALGAVLVVPAWASVASAVALHRFAARDDETALAALSACVRAPLLGLVARLGLAAFVLGVCVALLLYTAPGAALGIAEWTMRADVAHLRATFSGPAWFAVAVVGAWWIVDLLVWVSFGLVEQAWRETSDGADLDRTLRDLEARAVSRSEVAA
jgi:hypothetical protein